MFGPDVCGSTKRVHFIVNYKGQNHLIKREVRPETDIYTHLYTAVIFPNQTYEVHLHAHLLFPSRLSAPSALSSLEIIESSNPIIPFAYKLFLQPFSPVHVFSCATDPH
jgi:hypothetical protein